MKGTIEFYPYCYLLIAAHNALEAAKLVEREGERGRNYHYMTAVVFSAFAVEAVVNHIGQDRIPDWDSNERNIRGLEARVKAVSNGNTPDFTTAPFKTVKEAVAIRHNLAHGKTWVGDQLYFDSGEGMHEQEFPNWLESQLNETRAVEVHSDAEKVIQTLLVWSGYLAYDLYTMGRGQGSEVTDPNAQPRPTVWKIKNS